MSEQIDYGWFLPSPGDAKTRLGNPDFAIEPSLQLFEDVSAAAEKAGFSYILIPTAGPCWEAWIAGAMMAAKTQTLKMLIALRPGYIKPAQLAKMIATLDQLSNGRVLINLIAGGSSAETAREGVNVPKEERYAMMSEEVELLKKIWASDGPITFEGKYHQVHDLVIQPDVKQDPGPAFFLGGASPDALEVSAKHSDVHLFWGDTPASIAEQIRAIKQKARAYGRENEIRFGMRLQIICREREEDAWAAAQDLIRDADKDKTRLTLFEDSAADKKMKSFSEDDDQLLAKHLWAGITKVRPGAGVAVVGNPQQVADTLKEFIAVGCTSFCLSGYPHDEEATRFGEYVRPLLV